MLLMIDNYDSFTYNLVQYFGELGEDVRVFRNDKVTIEVIEGLNPRRLVISPGPCTPKEAGISVQAISHFAGRLWVKLDSFRSQRSMAQALAVAFGGEVVRADRLMHGKTSMIHHNGSSIFHSLPNPFEATRYHSLVVKRETVPECLEVTAETAEGEIMGLRHRTLGAEGVQFHPESILTAAGMDLLRNFLKL